MSYDVAAYIWPAFTGDEKRTRMFWPQGMGEWQSYPNFPAIPGPENPFGAM